MSGRIQHHIPQSFQCGFLSCENKRQTYVYRIDKKYISNINRVAAQRDFYSKPVDDGARTLDDMITDYESRLDRLLIELRAAEVGSMTNPSVAAEVIAHLTPRGNSVRRMFGGSIESIVVGASKIFSDKVAVITTFGLDSPLPNSRWEQHFAPAIRESKDANQFLGLFSEKIGLPRPVLDRMLFLSAKEMIVGGGNPIYDEFKQLFSNLLSQVAGAIEESHKKMLKNELVAELRKETLEKLTWKIYPAPIEGAIMPDCIALGLGEEEDAFLPYILTSRPYVVVMPLTSKKILVGTDARHDAVDMSGFNDEAAQCSDELFIADSPSHAELSGKIGSRWKNKMDIAVQDALSRYRADNAICNAELTPINSASSISYQLTFNGAFENKDINSVSGLIQIILEKIKQWLDLSRLDGITFTSNFNEALEKADRNFDIHTVIEATPDHIAQGVAALLVMRDEKLKVRIVMSEEYAMSLVGEDMQNAGVALHLIVAGMSLTHAVDKFEAAVPGFLMEPVMTNNHDAMLHCAMRKALRAYRYAYDSAGCGSDGVVEQEFSNYLIHALGLAYGEIYQAKQVHVKDRDHPRLFNSVLGSVAEILTASARLLGHRDGFGNTPILDENEGADAAIAARQLKGWADAFSYDLREFWGREIRTREDLYALNIHVERILWSAGIFVYLEDDGQGTRILSI